MALTTYRVGDKVSTADEEGLTVMAIQARQSRLWVRGQEGEFWVAFRDIIETHPHNCDDPSCWYR